MHPNGRRPPPWRAPLRWTGVLAAVLVALVAVAGCAQAPGPVPAAPTTVRAPTTSGIVADPVRIRIPRIGVDASLVRLGVDGAGILQPPATADVAGWFADGVVPGERGPAVIAGHVDSQAGPGVFFDLRELRDGDRIEIVDGVGSARVFTVRYLEQTGKDRFPTAAVYGPSPVPALRVITCGGQFSRSGGTYRDNVIAHATFE